MCGLCEAMGANHNTMFGDPTDDIKAATLELKSRAVELERMQTNAVAMQLAIKSLEPSASGRDLIRRAVVIRRFLTGEIAPEDE